MTEAAGSFDIAAAAGWYSAVAGLLAGFALLAILLPLNHEAEDGDAVYGANAVVIYVCSFFSLLVLSISYAILAGRTGGGAAAGVAAHEQMLNGAAFGLATLLLLFGLHAILRTYGANRETFAPARDVIMTVTRCWRRCSSSRCSSATPSTCSSTVPGGGWIPSPPGSG